MLCTDLNLASLTESGIVAIKDGNREVSIVLNMPTDEAPVKLVIKLVKVLPADQCLQLYNITFRRYVAGGKSDTSVHSMDVKNIRICRICFSVYKSLQLQTWILMKIITPCSRYQNVSIFDFIKAKSYRGGGNNWSYKTCKAPVKMSPTTNHTQFSTGQMPFLSPSQRCQSTEGKWIFVKINK